jgi:isoleucyl-tRNA synthetase
VELGHKERDRANLKVRQPLAGATVPGPPLDVEMEAIVLDELNLKSVKYADLEAREVVMDTRLTPELRREGLAREVVRRIQGARKDAGYNIEDRIEVRYRADGELAEAIADWSERIKRETLALLLEPGDGVADFHAETQVDGQPLALALRRASA